MSSVIWDGDNLIQEVGGNVEELGHVKYDDNSKDYVLWLKDTRDVFGNNKGYIRGDSFPAMENAKQNAASSTSATLFHYMWMVSLRDDGKVSDKQLDRSKEDAEGSKPLTESKFKEVMEIDNKLNIRLFIFGHVASLVIGLFVGFVVAALV